MTPTHGSGLGRRLLAAGVEELDVVVVRGTATPTTAMAEAPHSHRDVATVSSSPAVSVLTLSRTATPVQLSAALVSGGCCGVITRVRIETVPAYWVRVAVYQHVTFHTVVTQFAKLMALADSVSVLLDWERLEVHSLWLRDRTPKKAVRKEEATGGNNDAQTNKQKS
eukprot:m.108323 g.108323  ORF g.108323 m.108323 type:complete len:167 (+) comp15900_c0_seq4:306-806(+)